MTEDKKAKIVKNLVPTSEIETEQNKLSLIYKLLRERHELQQVCLEIYKGLRQTDKMSLIEFTWESELERVLFESEIFLYCNRDLPKVEEEE
jgi:hypothetical protein